MDTDNTDDIALLANTPAQAKTLLHGLERAAVSIETGGKRGSGRLVLAVWHDDDDDDEVSTTANCSIILQFTFVNVIESLIFVKILLL